jgi:nitroreductase
MTLTEILKTRRSVRKFDGRTVARDLVEALIGLALTAPSSKNTRSTRFMVIDDRATLRRVSTMRDFGSALLADAPCAVLVAGDASSSDLWLDNAAISAITLQYAASEAGLGSCWVHVNGRPMRREDPDGPTAEDHLREFLPLPADWRPLCMVALGYAAEPTKPHAERDESARIIWL